MAISQQNHVFIDPAECGSSIGYYINLVDYYNKKEDKTTYSLHATVSLTDCSHKIDWSFGDDSLAKIDTALAMLQEFRRKYAEMQKTFSKLNK